MNTVTSSTIDTGDVARHARALHQALRSGVPIDPLSDTAPGIGIADAYAIAQALLAFRLAEGETVVGKKIGLTSAAVQGMLGVDQPDFGTLTDAMAYSDGDVVPLAGMIAPRAEGEIAFVLKRDLLGPGVTPHDVLAATEAVVPCFEIVDSRIRDWKIRIVDTVADNASAAAFVLGAHPVRPHGIDLSTCGMVVEKNGDIVATGAGAAALGSPLTCVAWLANTLGRFGIPLRAGEVILSGALVPLVPVATGDAMRVRIGGIGSVDVRFG